MKIEDIRKVLIIGAGTMGQQIGFQCALNGYDVVMYDTSDEMLKNAKSQIEEIAQTFVIAGRVNNDLVPGILGRIVYSRNAEEAAQEVDFVSESIPEDPELKGRVFAEFNRLCPARTIFTTNTSSLVPSMFAEETGRPDKFAAFHFHDIRITNVVDIMPHPGTSKETIELISAFSDCIGQQAIVLEKEQSGYVFNTMLMSLFESAQTLAEREVASVEDIDKAWMGVMHTIMGPFGIMDSIGLDTVWKVTDYWANQTGLPQSLANASFMKQYPDRGDLGVKTGQGFYSYPDPAYTAPDFIKK